MKNLIIVLILLLSINFAYSKTVEIDTKDGKVTIIVADNIEDLEQDYLKTMKSYLEAEADLKEILTMNQSLSFRIEELIPALEKTNKKNNELILLLENRPIKIKTLINPFVMAGINYFPNEQKISASIGGGVGIWEKVILGVGIGFPDLSVNFSLGVFIR